MHPNHYRIKRATLQLDAVLDAVQIPTLTAVQIWQLALMAMMHASRIDKLTHSN